MVGGIPAKAAILCFLELSGASVSLFSGRTRRGFLLHMGVAAVECVSLFGGAVGVAGVFGLREVLFFCGVNPRRFLFWLRSFGGGSISGQFGSPDVAGGFGASFSPIGHLGNEWMVCVVCARAGFSFRWSLSGVSGKFASRGRR